MKNLPKILGITALIAVMVLFVVSCDLDDCPPHTWGDWIVEDAASISFEGEEVRTCVDCNEKQTRTLYRWTALYGHEWRNSATDSANNQTLTISASEVDEDLDEEDIVEKGVIKLVHDDGETFTFTITHWENTEIVQGSGLNGIVGAFKIFGTSVTTNKTNGSAGIYYDTSIEFDFYVTAEFERLRIRWYYGAATVQNPTGLLANPNFSTQTFVLVPAAD